MPDLNSLLKEMTRKGASDLHLSVGTPPQIRVDGKLQRLDYPVLGPEETRNTALTILNEDQKAFFEKKGEIDLSFGVPNLSRFRANIYRQRDNVSAAFRRIPFEIRSFTELGLPPLVEELIQRPHGLVLVTGTSGSGKSTTLATMVDWINTHRKGHIITIEDPIEFLHSHKHCIVDQHQIGSDTTSFAAALRSVLRQDPDVVMVGELRDLESIEIALTIAETGHLVLATLHTSSCVGAISRTIDVFPPDQLTQVRVQLSLVLNGIITQQLVPRIGGGLVLALELMLSTTAIRALVRDNKIHQIDSYIQMGRELGMRRMDHSLLNLYNKDFITKEDAILRAADPRELTKMIKSFVSLEEEETPAPGEMSPSSFS